MARILDSILGQDVAKARLLHAVETQRLPQTLIFAGQSGVGKKALALGLTQALVCPESSVGCGQCPTCLNIERGQSEHLLVLDGTDGVIKIEMARQAIHFTTLRLLGRARIILIDQAHFMNPQAANALLKTLEEPPAQTYFFLVTSALHSLLPTIRSRSQVVRLSPLSLEIVRQITGIDGWEAVSAQGSVERAQMLRGEDWEGCRTRGFAYLSSILHRDREEGFACSKDIAADRSYTEFCLEQFQQFWRDVFLVQQGQNNLIHRDQLGLIQLYQELPPALIGLFYEQLVLLTRDLDVNVDRLLLLENYWLYSCGLLERFQQNQFEMVSEMC